MSTRSRMIASIIVALIPAIVVVVLIATTQQSTPFTRRLGSPGLYSDEIVHWAQAATFRAVGLSGGYYTANEQTPPLPLFRFYSWGPAIPAFYGTIAFLTGWEFYTPILINLSLLGIATVLLINLTRLRLRQIAWVAIILLTYPPLVMFAPTVMLQVLYQATAVVLALLFYQLVIRESVSDHGFVLAVVAVLVASLLRVTWSLMLIPLFIIHIAERPTIRKALIEFSLMLVLIGATFALYYGWSAPFPNIRNRMMDQMAVNLMDGLQGFVENAAQNIERAFEGNETQVILRFQMLVITVFAFVPLVRAFRLRKIKDKQALRLTIVHVCNLAGVFAVMVIAYDLHGWRDYRAFAPHVLFSLLLLVLANHERLLGFLIVVSFIAYVTIWPQYLDTMNNFNRDNFQAYTERMSSKATRYQNAGIRFRPEAASPWCNTVLYTQPYFRDTSSLFAFDDGLGLSLLEDTDDLQMPPLSHYLLLDDRTVAFLGERINVKRLVDLPTGALYENLDSACEETVPATVVNTD